jgi:hypothetical protein
MNSRKRHLDGGTVCIMRGAAGESPAPHTRSVGPIDSLPDWLPVDADVLDEAQPGSSATPEWLESQYMDLHRTHLARLMGKEEEEDVG